MPCYANALQCTLKLPDRHAGLQLRPRKETLANLTGLPEESIAALRLGLRGRTLVDAAGAFEVERSVPHGDVAAAHVMASQLGLAGLLGPACRERDIAYPLVLSLAVRPAKYGRATASITALRGQTGLGMTREAATEWLICRAVTGAEYAFDNLAPEARDRFAALEACCDPLTQAHLAARGVGAGWRYLEIGAGGGSIARWLGSQVGQEGYVLATDLDPRWPVTGGLAAAQQLVAAGRRVSGRTLRTAGLHGSNASLGALARLLNDRQDCPINRPAP